MKKKKKDVSTKISSTKIKDKPEYNLEIKGTYDLLAKDYYESRKNGEGTPGFYNVMLEMPNTLKLLGSVRGNDVLDLGCGPGFYAQLLTEKGAKVVGMDISKESVKIARETNPALTFVVGDMTKKLPFRAGQFDVVISPMVLDHINDWKPVLLEINRVLKKHGRFVFSMYNPVMERQKKKWWFFRNFSVIENYFDEEWRHREWAAEGKKGPIAHHHKTYGTIVRLLVEAGFDIIDYDDAYPIPAAKEKYPAKYKRYTQVPHFCTWVVRKR